MLSLQPIQHISCERFKYAGIFQFTAVTIGRILSCFCQNQYSISVRGYKLFGKLIEDCCIIYIVPPAMKPEYQVDCLFCIQFLWRDDQYSTVMIMLLCRV